MGVPFSPELANGKGCPRVAEPSARGASRGDALCASLVTISPPTCSRVPQATLLLRRRRPGAVRARPRQAIAYRGRRSSLAYGVERLGLRRTARHHRAARTMSACDSVVRICARRPGSLQALCLFCGTGAEYGHAGAPRPTLAQQMLASVIVLSPMSQGGANSEFGDAPA